MRGTRTRFSILCKIRSAIAYDDGHLYAVGLGTRVGHCALKDEACCDIRNSSFAIIATGVDNMLLLFGYMVDGSQKLEPYFSIKKECPSLSQGTLWTWRLY
jgi:hypothetical protein